MGPTESPEVLGEDMAEVWLVVEEEMSDMLRQRSSGRSRRD